MAGLGTLHHDTYFERMRASLGDKARILDHLVPGSVLDVGAGDGGLVQVLRQHGWDAVGVDASPEAVARSGGLVVPGNAEDIDRLFPGRRFANVVFCSVLHEVWSYGVGDRDAHWQSTVAAAAGLLAPGGRIVVRDGVGPARPQEVWRLTADDPEDAGRFLTAWTAMASGLLGPIRIELDGADPTGPAWQVTEFLMTYGWGWESLPREGAERYTAAGTLGGHGERLSAATGLQLVLADSWLQDGYAAAFDRVGTLHQQTSEGWQPIPWPHSNALWVLAHGETATSAD